MKLFFVCGILLFLCCNTEAGVFVPEACYTKRFEEKHLIIDDYTNVESKKRRTPFKPKKGMDKIISLRMIDTSEYIVIEPNGQRILVEGHGLIKEWIKDIDPMPYINKNEYR